MSKSIVAYGAALGLLISLGAVDLAAAGASPTPPTASASAPLAPDAAAQRNQIRYDESIRRGVLPNGLRYAVMRNATPKGGVSVRLGIDVGSYEEADDERGIAHFVEHMAFNGTRNVPEDQIEALFAPMGVAFGRDLNAATSLFSTVYQLDLPDTEAAPRATALRWLRDVADGMKFEDTAVVRERGVIRAEADSRDGPAMRVHLASAGFLTPQLRSTARDPIGTPEVVAGATAAKVRAFHQRWYRPDNAVVVMVGDLPPETLEAELKSVFESWTAAGPKPARAGPGKLDLQRGVEALSVSEPRLATSVSACRLRAPEDRSATPIERLRRDAAARVWQIVLDRRLADLRQQQGTSVLGAGMLRADYTRDVLTTCLAVAPTGDAWDTALLAAQAELRRFAAEGPTDKELETAVEQIRSNYRGGVSSGATRESPALADGLVEAELEGDPFPTPREALRTFNLAVEDLDGAAVKAAFVRDWVGAGPLLVLTAPEAPARETVVAAWRKGETAPSLAAYQDRPAGVWAYNGFGAPGRVEKREPVAQGDFVRLRYRNGLVVNFKHTDFKQNDVLVRLRFGAGRRELGSANLWTSSMAAGLVTAGGLGRHSAEELATMFSDTAWSADLDVGNDGFVFDGHTNRSSLQTQLQIMAAFASDPGFRSSVDALLPTTIDAAYRSYSSVPSLAAGEAMAEAVAPDSPMVMPGRDALVKMRSADFARVIRPALTEAPLELTIVGDVSEDEVSKLVAASLGALPARKAAPRAGPDAWFLRYPEPTPKPVRVTHQGPADQAVAMVIWPLYVATPERRREEYALSLLAEVLSSELRMHIREELGMTYAPEAGTDMPDHADQGSLTAVIEARPGDLDVVVAEVAKVAQRLASGDISPAELEAARTPMLASDKSEQSSNELWAAAIDGSATNDQGVKDVLEYAGILRSLSLDEVKAAAKAWLSRPPIVITAVPAGKTAAVAAPAAVAAR